MATPHATEAEAPGRALSGLVLYSRLTEGIWQIWQLDLASDRQAQLTRTAEDKRRPSWAPEGRVTYCTSSQSCFQLDPETHEPQPLLSSLWPVRHVAWSADGRRVAFSKFRTDLLDSANIWVADASGAESRILTHEPGIQYQPAWSPDGTRIAYAGGHGYGTYDIYVIGADGSERWQLTANQAHEFLPAWSPDGQWIAFTSDRTGDEEIWVMRSDGSDQRQLTQSPGLDTNPSWSPDGRHLLFVSNRIGSLCLWIMERDGSGQRQLLEEAAEMLEPAWNAG